MKLDKLFQSLLLTGAVVVFISIPAKSEETQGESSTATVRKSTFKDTLGVRVQESVNSKSPVLASSNRKHRHFPSQVASSLGNAKSEKSNRKILQLSEIEQVSQSAELLVQSPGSSEVIQVTGVQANPTEKGVEVILQTTQGEQLQITNRSAENNFIADIPNAQLRLPNGDGFTFRSEKPAAGITEITVTNIDANTVRVTVIGEKTLPTVELFDDNAGLVFGITSAVTAIQPPLQPEPEQPTSETPQEEPSAQSDEPIELVVTGEQDGYRVPNASTATRTETPLRDIPQSIQVVPQQVLEDRKVSNLTEATETVSGVSTGQENFSPASVNRVIRGFNADGNFRNGFRDTDTFANTAIGTVEQVEVLKGPASVLFGSVEPGGIVNVTTKQPLSTPYYKLGLDVGSYGLYQPSIDLSGPLTTDKNLLYRFIGSYRASDSVVDFANSEVITIAPSITWKLGDRTNLNLFYEYIRSDVRPFKADVPILSDNTFLPRNFYNGYPDIDFNTRDTHKFGYILNHQFNENWQIRNNLSVVLNSSREAFSIFSNLVDDRIQEGSRVSEREYDINNYFGQFDLLGKFKTGTIAHQVLIGFDANRNVENFESRSGAGPGDLDILNPNYDTSNYQFVPDSRFAFYEPIQSYGLYLQDQITLLDNLKLLIGGRFDWVERTFDVVGEPAQEQSDSAFSPRIGLVYQPSDTVSLYASYSQSFTPTFGANPDGRAFKPTKGTQYEAGIKADFLDGKLSATLAAYQITKTNVTTRDPDPVLAAQGFSIQIGEQESRGIELDIVGEILPGWKVIASYSHINAEVTEDNITPVGNRLNNVPENQASLWTTYEIQQGNLQGLGFGLGLFYVGDRQGDLDNSFVLPSYLRTDAAIYYRRDRLKAAINIRNLFDVTYQNYSFGRLFNQVGDPLTVVGSLSWEL
jgi:iron complex outermembrane recepter protein